MRIEERKNSPIRRRKTMCAPLLVVTRFSIPLLGSIINLARDLERSCCCTVSQLLREENVSNHKACWRLCEQQRQQQQQQPARTRFRPSRAARCIALVGARDANKSTCPSGARERQVRPTQQEDIRFELASQFESSREKRRQLQVSF